MNIGYLLICLCLPKYLSLMFYCFKCTDLTFLFKVNFILNILFDATVNGIIFLIWFSVSTLLVQINIVH